MGNNMARMQDEQDTRPRNLEDRRRIEEMMDPRKLLDEIDMNIDSRDHSIDDHLENTSDFRHWAQRKRKGTNLDPEYIKPTQISDSPISDFDIQFTRYEHTNDTYTPSSLSSLNVPQVSNASLTMLNHSTPRNSLRKSKLPRPTRSSNHLTPNEIVRKKQIKDLKRRATANGEIASFKRATTPKTPRDRESERFFASTPVHNQKKRASFFDRLSGVDAVSTESIPSIPKDAPAGNSQEFNGNTYTVDDESEHTLTNGNQNANDEAEHTLTNENQNANNEVVPEIIIPETQENESIIPETQNKSKSILHTPKNKTASETSTNRRNTLPRGNESRNNNANVDFGHTFTNGANDEAVSEIIVPETQENESAIPETQNESKSKTITLKNKTTTETSMNGTKTLKNKTSTETSMNRTKTLPHVNRSRSNNANDEFGHTFTNENGNGDANDEDDPEIIIPETQENESIILETQDQSNSKLHTPKNKTASETLKNRRNTLIHGTCDWNPSVVIQRIETNTPQIINKSIAKRKSSLNLRDSQPFDAILPPDEFQDSSIIIEGSPITSQRKFDEPIRKSPPEKVMPRKRSQKQKNEDLVIVERNLKAIENKPRSSARTSRRLLPVSDIHENDETSETKSTESEKADSSKNVDESTRADKDSFKKPTAPAPRTTRATTKRNDSRASSATTSDLGASHDEFTYDIEPVTEIEPPNIHVDDEEPGTSNQSEQKSPSPKRKSNTKSRSRATKTKESKKSKPETNEPEIENDATSEDTVSSNELRKSTRKKAVQDATYSRALFMAQSLKSSVKLSVKPNLKKSRTAPVTTTREDNVSAPPSKRPRKNDDLSNKTSRPSTSSKSDKSGTSRSHYSKQSVHTEKTSTIDIDTPYKIKRPSKTSKSEIIGARTSRPQSTKMSLQMDKTSKTKNLGEFTVHLRPLAEKFKKQQFWQETIDLDQKDPIFHNDEEVDVRHVRTNTHDYIEVSSSDKIEYHEMNGVQYGFIPSALSKRCGFMRFPPNAVKDKGPNHDTIFLSILAGRFTVELDDRNFEVSAGADVPIPKGVSFGLRNQSDYIGIVYFCY